jgi:hypothetical protein
LVDLLPPITLILNLSAVNTPLRVPMGLTQAFVGHEEGEPFEGGFAVGFRAAAEEGSAVEGVAELGFAEEGECLAFVVSGWWEIVIADRHTVQLSSGGRIVNWELFTAEA